MSDTIVCRLEGADHLIQVMYGLSAAARGRIAKDAVDEGAAVIQFHAQLNARNVFSDKQRGQLRNSIRSESRITGSGAEAEVAPHTIYARIQEFGGVVRPVRAQVLHWVDDAGQDHFAKSVTITEHPYMRPAALDHQAQIADVMSAAVQDGILEEIG